MAVIEGKGVKAVNQRQVWNYHMTHTFYATPATYFCFRYLYLYARVQP